MHQKAEITLADAPAQVSPELTYCYLFQPRSGEPFLEHQSTRCALRSLLANTCRSTGGHRLFLFFLLLTLKPEFTAPSSSPRPASQYLAGTSLGRAGLVLPKATECLRLPLPQRFELLDIANKLTPLSTPQGARTVSYGE